jgi:predicted CopG family antitoxin
MNPHTDTHRIALGTKNIAISEEAYQRLKALKKPGESFTEVIERMTRSRGVLELSGILSKQEAARVGEVVRETREESSRRLGRTVERLG